MTKVNEPAHTASTVGQVAEQLGVTVRTLHHYDAIGLLVPSERTSAGYRLYDGRDITRLQHVAVYRRLGFTLEEIALLLDDPSADEAEQRWGESEARKQSHKRTSKYTKAEWAEVKAEMDAAEQHRLHIERWFYDITPEFHRGVGDMYIADPRFTKTYGNMTPGMAQYVRGAIHGNADRAARAAGGQS